MKPCCTPARQTETAPREAANIARGPDTGASSAITIPGGTALIGTDAPHYPHDGEGPLRRKKLASFSMDATTVTNARFAAFVADTGYETDAERLGDSLVFQWLLPKGTPPTQAVADAPWWRVVPGANWQHPLGPNGPDAPLDGHHQTIVRAGSTSAYAVTTAL